jgi:hypothetical protein
LLFFFQFVSVDFLVPDWEWENWVKAGRRDLVWSCPIIHSLVVHGADFWIRLERGQLVRVAYLWYIFMHSICLVLY